MSIAELVWGGEVPIRFSLAREEITTNEFVPPLYVCILTLLFLEGKQTVIQLMLSRNSYLLFAAAEIRSHFFSSGPPVEDELW